MLVLGLGVLALVIAALVAALENGAFDVDFPIPDGWRRDRRRLP
jgi:hypothetical protein